MEVLAGFTTPTFLCLTMPVFKNKVIATPKQWKTERSATGLSQNLNSQEHFRLGTL
jgi:hypothetical protein